MAEKRDQGILVIKKMFRIQEHMINYPNGIPLGDLAAQLDIKKSTLFRILDTLCELGYVLRSSTNGSYRLSNKYFLLANSTLNLDLRETIRPFLQRLSMEIGKTVHLIVRQKNYGIYLDHVINPMNQTSLRISSNIGDRLPLHSTAGGKVFLAYSPPNIVFDIIQSAGMPAKTKRTITELSDLKVELNNIRQREYAIENEENEENIYSVAAPIFNYSREVVAVVSVMETAFSMTKEGMDFLIDKLRTYSMLASEELGYNKA